jgi:5'-nucleotidase
MAHKIKSNPNRPLILITNDDSIYSKGIRSLIDAVKHLGDVVVIAPSLPQSGMGHAVTLHEPLRLTEIKRFEGILASYACSGTPVDSVKIARDVVLDRKPDICLSGINHGSNSSINVIYSGTMSAAVEAGIEAIPSVGFSLSDHSADADFELSAEVVAKITKEMLENPQKMPILLNVNIPNIKKEELKGYKICRQAVAKWEEEFEQRTDPRGSIYYWLTGKFKNYDHQTDTDEWALANGYVSIVPVQFDLTNYKAMDVLNNNWHLND